MTANDFSLQSVLKLRQAEVTQSRAAVLEAERSAAALQGRLADAEATLHHAQRQRRQALAAPGRLDLSLAQSCTRHERHLQARIASLESQLQEALGRVQAERDQLTRADGDARALERLDEKQNATARWRLQRSEIEDAQGILVLRQNWESG